MDMNILTTLNIYFYTSSLSFRQKTTAPDPTVESHIDDVPIVPNVISTRSNHPQHVLQRIHRFKL